MGWASDALPGGNSGGRLVQERGVSLSASPLMTAEEVATMLGMTPSWVYDQSRRGLIPTVTLGRYRRYRREAIEAWVEQLEQDGPRPARRAA